jgi:hypothetical protein
VGSGSDAQRSLPRCPFRRSWKRWVAISPRRS